jgi:prepilin-type N-terminal cleavage/methylation domain-containing protein
VNTYRANEVAQRLGISKQTLIRYEKKGIFARSHRNRINHWREYTEEDIQKMAKIIGRGFTLIETIMVIVIIAILAVISIPKIQAVYSTKLNSAVKMFVSDLRYVQQLAVTQHDTYRVNFNTITDSYEVRKISNNSLIKHPFTRNDFVVYLRTDPHLSGVEIVSPNCGGTQGVQFNWRGVPQNTSNVTLSSEGSVTLSYSGSSKTIFIRQNTGTLRVQ